MLRGIYGSWHPWGISQSHSAGTAGGAVTLKPTHQRNPAISPGEKFTIKKVPKTLLFCKQSFTILFGSTEDDNTVCIFTFYL